MSPPVFYHTPLSPCSRGALLAARLLGVEVEVRNINLFTGEQLRQELVDINPTHTIPTLDDNGFAVVDSHAIATYLADKYGKDEKLYPKDLYKRSIVDQRLYFDAGVLYKRLRDICFPIFFQNGDTIPEDKKEKVHEALEWLEGYLKSSAWVAGDHITIADALCVSSVTTFIAEGCELDKYPKVQAWLENCRKTIPDFEEVDGVGTAEFHAAFKSKLKPGQI